MNGIEKITAKLESEARAEIEAINAETAVRCEEIKKEYEKKARDEYWKRVQDGTKSVENRVERMASAADMEAKKSVLAFKQEMVSEAFDRAVQNISEMPREEYIAFLAGQTAKAASTGTEELIFNARDRKEFGADAAKAANALLKKKGLAGGLTVSDETRDIPGGLIVKQGDIEVNCSVDILVQLYRNELASQVAEILFA
ncbi:MAG: V-type ATP synthase subunit E [Butyricicoccus sp.]|nr:V-type ATP synthase subunit E [Butyricicoccus sp.]